MDVDTARLITESGGEMTGIEVALSRLITDLRQRVADLEARLARDVYGVDEEEGK